MFPAAATHRSPPETPPLRDCFHLSPHCEPSVVAPSLSSLQGIKGLFLGAAAVAPHSVQFLLCTEEPVQRLDPCALSTPGTTTDRWTAGGIRVWAWIHHWCCVTNLTEQVVELQSWGLQVKDPRTDAAGAANVLHPNNNIIIILNNCKPSLWTTMWMVITCLWK